MIGDNGYMYKHDNSPDFDHFSQKKYYSIDGSGPENFTDLYNDKKKANVLAFHRKKGLLSEYMDKNGWKNDVMPIMGFERSP